MTGSGSSGGPGAVSGSGSGPAGPAPAGSGSGDVGTSRGSLFAGGRLPLPSAQFQPHNFGLGTGSRRGARDDSRSSPRSCSASPPATRISNLTQGGSSQTTAQSQSQVPSTQHKQLRFQDLLNRAPSPAYTVGGVEVRPAKGRPLGSGLNTSLGENSQTADWDDTNRARAEQLRHPLPDRPRWQRPTPQGASHQANTPQTRASSGANQPASAPNRQPPPPVLSSGAPRSVPFSEYRFWSRERREDENDIIKGRNAVRRIQRSRAASMLEMERIGDDELLIPLVDGESARETRSPSGGSQGGLHGRGGSHGSNGTHGARERWGGNRGYPGGTQGGSYGSNGAHGAAREDLYARGGGAREDLYARGGGDAREDMHARGGGGSRSYGERERFEDGPDVGEKRMRPLIAGEPSERVKRARFYSQPEVALSSTSAPGTQIAWEELMRLDSLSAGVYAPLGLLHRSAIVIMADQGSKIRVNTSVHDPDGSSRTVQIIDASSALFIDENEMTFQEWNSASEALVTWSEHARLDNILHAHNMAHFRILKDLFLEQSGIAFEVVRRLDIRLRRLYHRTPFVADVNFYKEQLNDLRRDIQDEEMARIRAVTKGAAGSRSTSSSFSKQAPSAPTSTATEGQFFREEQKTRERKPLECLLCSRRGHGAQDCTHRSFPDGTPFYSRWVTSSKSLHEANGEGFICTMWNVSGQTKAKCTEHTSASHRCSFCGSQDHNAFSFKCKDRTAAD
ncbi:hypothetical protein BKA70DRAFT_604068 [Coprinopsis sp. MPI-PUGE-AT-0042]|nr:hypothetical protein BKA70DRAFT_604068 [Coprinopsis sp. MPI-PUGE-AT-0042]